MSNEPSGKRSWKWQLAQQWSAADSIKSGGINDGGASRKAAGVFASRRHPIALTSRLCLTGNGLVLMLYVCRRNGRAWAGACLPLFSAALLTLEGAYFSRGAVFRLSVFEDELCGSLML